MFNVKLINNIINVYILIDYIDFVDKNRIICKRKLSFCEQQKLGCGCGSKTKKEKIMHKFWKTEAIASE